VVVPLVPVISALGDVLAFLAPVLTPLIELWLAYRAALLLATVQTALAEGGTISLTVAQLAARAALFLTWVQVSLITEGTILYTVAQYATRAATLAWAAAQWVLNAALDANPISLVILGLVALGAALVLAWQHSAAFRDVVESAWRAIWGTVSPIISALVGAVTRGFTAMWNTIRTVTGWIRANWQTLMIVLVGIATGGLGALVLLVVRYWTQIRNFSATIWAQVTGIVSSAWSRMITGAENAGGQIIGGLRSGMAAAMRGIGGWLKGAVVDPIVRAVKGFFGIHSPSTVFEGIGSNLIGGLVRGVMHNAGAVVKTIFGGWPSALASVLGKGLASITSLPAKALSALGHVGGSILGKLAGLFGGGGGGGTGQYRGLMLSVLSMFGVPQLLGTFMTQMNTESGGNARAINLSDSNAAAGTPSKGLMQVIDPTFNAFAGPFRSRGIWDPLANIYAAVAYALSRYGGNIAAVLGHGHGYALGGTLYEPVVGIGQHSGDPYAFAENGPERWSPLSGGMTADERALAAMGTRAGHTINIYPREHQSETDIAASVNASLAWADAGGRA
jgi:hypothetical protein